MSDAGRLLPDNQDLDPIWQTATAIYLTGPGAQPIDLAPLDATQTLDPLLQQATDMVRQATETAAAPHDPDRHRDLRLPNGHNVPIFQPTADTVRVRSFRARTASIEVQPSDPNLYRISLQFGIPYMSIARQTNMVNPNMIHVGDTLIIPGCGTTGYQPPPTSTPAPITPARTPSPGGGSGQTIRRSAGRYPVRAVAALGDDRQRDCGAQRDPERQPDLHRADVLISRKSDQFH